MLGFGVEVAIIALIGLVTWFIWDHLDGKDQPPGPLRLPFLGNLIQAAVSDPVPYVGLYKLCKRYGKHGVTRIQMGFMNTVVINSLDAMKDIYTREECLGRCVGEEAKVRNMHKNLGVLMGDGRQWMVMRRFILATLKSFGMSKRSVMESIISSEATAILEEMKIMSKSSKDGTISVQQDTFAVTTLNIILWMVTGYRCDRHDKSSVVNRFLKVGREFFDSFSLVSGLYNYWPFLKSLCPGLSGYTKAQELSKKMHDIAREVLYEARVSGNYRTSQDCYVDEFLAKMDQEEGDGSDKERFFTEDQFIVTLMDLIQAGSDTTSGNLTFGILLLASHPEIQEKFVNEIVDVIKLGGGIPCLDDRDKMPYTQAVILEIIRYARVLIFLPRLALKDFCYQDYHIKQGTAIMLSAHNIAMDTDVWEDPNIFRPERFISQDESFNKSFADERILPFGIGKKSCVGEGIARDAMFLILTTIMKKLKFSLPEDRPTPSLIPLLAIMAYAAPFTVVVTSRE